MRGIKNNLSYQETRNQSTCLTHDSLLSPWIQYHLYADDSQIYISFKTDVSSVRALHEKLDLQKFTRCKYGAKKCKLGGNQKQRC